MDLKRELRRIKIDARVEGASNPLARFFWELCYKGYELWRKILKR